MSQKQTIIDDLAVTIHLQVYHYLCLGFGLFCKSFQQGVE